MKKVISIILSTILLMALMVPAAAAGGTPTEKEEVVYSVLGLDGSVGSIYVVNIFNTGKVTDYGSYTAVENLTNSDPIEQNGDEVTVDTDAARLYYQGTLETKELPWNFAVTYTLDGEEVPASELAGASGALSIHILITRNTDVDATFFDNYALQIALSLDTELCENIEAEGATVADAGADKQLGYIVLPGKGADITVTADVHDFAMDAITFNGIRLSLSLDIDDTDFTSQLAELKDAVAGLDDGAGELLIGANQLYNGMTQYLAGLATYTNSLGDLSVGASQLASGASGLADGLDTLVAQNDALVAGALSMQQATFDAVNAQLSGMGLPTLTPDNYSDVLSGNSDLSAVKTQLDNVVQFAQGIKGYTAGVAALQDGAADLSDGAAQLSASLPQVDSGAQDLYNGAAQLLTAIGSLKEGLAAYKDGSAELREGTDGLDAKISDQIDKLLLEISGGDEVKSFVSDKNTDVSSVQFVIKTGAVELPEEDSAAAVQTDQTTFWDRLLALFGID